MHKLLFCIAGCTALNMVAGDASPGALVAALGGMLAALVWQLVMHHLVHWLLHWVVEVGRGGLNYQAQFILINQVQAVLGNRVQLGL